VEQDQRTDVLSPKKPLHSEFFRKWRSVVLKQPSRTGGPKAIVCLRDEFLDREVFSSVQEA